MKRIISFVLALTMILTFCACGAPGKLKPYLNGLQLGADATDMRKFASSLNEAGTINGILRFLFTMFINKCFITIKITTTVFFCYFF